MDDEQREPSAPVSAPPDPSLDGSAAGDDPGPDATHSAIKTQLLLGGLFLLCLAVMFAIATLTAPYGAACGGG